ncbi:hypothetical protein SYNPS1DRAFT_22518 [Syncephalis pseudoplumigaleata]|uniref:Uncharacterized protein n=1 Tax=Syncephalis pseudoplumigaleata TaxID=1712513 RepID=A0A4P9YZV1_9FUNG|nr:hypothetical protein SYNPS1DRAFT_22518 [Syncephalis pseudoplumigaleata]|eukprot:RKP25538.1 hypothetical protein SYNPS1DRAFT_22518 [Syncephalis pseudoplumigaleata]
MAVTYAEIPRDGTLERIFNEQPVVFAVFAAIYILIAVAQLVYAVRYRNKHYLFFVLAFSRNILIPFWTFLIYTCAAELLDQWCKSMRKVLARAAVIGRVVAISAMICIMLAFSVQVIAHSLLRKGYIIHEWLATMAMALHLLGLNMLMLMAGVLLKLSPSKFAFRNDRKRREIALLLAIYLLLLLHRVFTQVRVPYTEFAIFPLIGLFTLYPVNALHGYSQPANSSKARFGLV